MAEGLCLAGQLQGCRITLCLTSCRALFRVSSLPVVLKRTPIPQALTSVQGNGSGSGSAVSTDQTSRRGPTRPGWWAGLSAWVQHADEESYTCYVLFILIFVLDFSLLTMLFPVSLAAYALATQKPSRHYWQVTPSALFCAGCVSVFKKRLFEDFKTNIIQAPFLTAPCRLKTIIVKSIRMVLEVQNVWHAVLCCACCGFACHSATAAVRGKRLHVLAGACQ